MDAASELAKVLAALRVGAIDPQRLAEAAATWDDSRPGFFQHLLDQGLLDTEKLNRAEPSTAAPPAGTTLPFASPPADINGAPLPSTIPEGTTPQPVDTGSDSSTATHAPGTTEPWDVAGHSTGSHAPGGTPTLVTLAEGTGPYVNSGDGVRPPYPGGRYRLLRLHRTGGLGQVWVARDEVVGREVAIKTLRPDRPADPPTRRRFLQEARATARLEHPGIVPLYDLVEPSGGAPPYYAMRFVAGRTLAEEITRFHNGPSGRLELANLLDKFVAVCRAVAFSHSRNVLHRDLKGQNIVLGDFGEVFLLDWGLAREAGEPDAPATVFPMAGGAPGDGTTYAVAGTPAFMAPETASGNPASVRSDVYGLGAILYTILTGKNPYDRAPPDEILRKVVASPPLPPRAVQPSVPPALEAVCLKAMARNPTDRYGSADDLATEVRRWLADEPVESHRDRWTARAFRWSRRHRTAVAAAGVFLVTAVITLTATVVLVWREKDRTSEQREVAEREWRRAEDERDRAEEAHGRATRNFDTARTLAIDLSARISALETGLADPRQTDLARKAALNEARAAFDRFRASAPDDVPLQAQAAALHRYAANLARLLNEMPEAEKAYAASLGLWETLAERFPADPLYRDNLAQTIRDYALLQKRTGKLREATAALDRAANLAEGLKGQIPEPSFRRTLGMILLDRANVEARRGVFDAAEGSARRAEELLDGLKAAPSGQRNPLDPLLAAIALLERATALREMNRTKEAMAVYDTVVARLDAELKAMENRDVRHFSYMARVERAVLWARDPEKTSATAQEVGKLIEGAEKFIAEFPRVAVYSEVLVTAYLCQGELLAAEGRHELANDILNKALMLTRDLVDRHGQMPDHVGLRARVYLFLGRTAIARGKREEAATLLGNAASVFKIARRKDPDNVRHRRGLEEAEQALAVIR
jgi:tetratricopeptide (TPR) repeat protein/tRNA A-37 threonylcarbamoyl transferase component Bud32